MQGKALSCAGSREVPGVADTALGGGELVLSELALAIAHSFCSRCIRGIVSSGEASGVGPGGPSEEKDIVLEALGGAPWTLSTTWSLPAPYVTSTLVVGARSGRKQDSVR